ncbi:terminase small subunit [Cellulomonas endometrii]|uniref:terminase small subunit n=1 Tax=Cellulomonas endometrii TaxID=3036301 RepID=UPI0024AD0920|nr:hypothetical protein [Cellulomonas endometrii]
MTKMHTPLLDALEEAVADAKHLTVRDAAAIEAARALARKIDAWDVIVEWAIDDANQNEGRPQVPTNDNVSLPSFLKYLDALQLVPPAAEKAKPGPASTASSSQQALTEMRKGLALVPEVG